MFPGLLVTVLFFLDLHILLWLIVGGQRRQAEMNASRVLHQSLKVMQLGFTASPLAHVHRERGREQLAGFGVVVGSGWYSYLHAGSHPRCAARAGVMAFRRTMPPSALGNCCCDRRDAKSTWWKLSTRPGVDVKMDGTKMRLFACRLPLWCKKDSTFFGVDIRTLADNKENSDSTA